MLLAHISEDGREQSIKEHLENTAEMAARFAEPFDMEEQAYAAGLLHDIGKYSDEFQKRLHGGPKVDHSTAGAVEAVKRRRIMEAFCVAGHHAGIPGCGGRADLEGTTLYARLNRAKKGNIPSYSSWADEISISEGERAQNMDMLEMSFKIRMLYSCLVDADFLDTEHFMMGEIDRGRKFCVEKLQDRLKEYINPWFPAENELNKLRCGILNHVMEEGERLGQGIYSLTVPTGGGKTVASLAFAIEHAKRNGLKRIIYVIPYTSIIEQTASVFRKILGEDIVLEHHCNVECGEDEDTLFNLRVSENWDMPVVVTTSVQFFESFYKNKASSSRKLHNIAKSVIIFDEAQMLPVTFLKPCIALVVELVKSYKASAVLCTATQPSLDKIIKEFYPEYRVHELCQEKYYDNDVFRRVTYTFDGRLSYELLIKFLNENEQYLCIVNSRRAAQRIYSLMSGEGCFHLSTNMYPAHRKKVLAEIRKRLGAGMPCKVVSTSLIEAGVDVDFPCVYRQIAGLDSMLQAGGRCNREGKRSKDESIVHIFDLECGSPELFSMQIASTEHVIKKYKDITSKEAIKEYFEQLFYLKGSDALDQYEIISRLRSLSLPFQDISDVFNLIDNDTRMLYIECEENQSIIEKVRIGIADKGDYRKLSLYGVSIYEYQYQELKKHAAIEVLHNGNCILIDSGLYSLDVGVNLEFKVGEAIMI